MKHKLLIIVLLIPLCLFSQRFGETELTPEQLQERILPNTPDENIGILNSLTSKAIVIEESPTAIKRA